MTLRIPPAERDALLRAIATRLGEPETFGAPHWYVGVAGWVLNTGDLLLVFGDETSFARGQGSCVVGIAMSERQYAVEGLVAITDPCDALERLAAVVFYGPTLAVSPPRPWRHGALERDVILRSYGTHPVVVMKTLRELIQGLSLKQAQKLIQTRDSRPWEQISDRDAETYAARLRAVGAIVDVVPSP